MADASNSTSIFTLQGAGASCVVGTNLGKSASDKVAEHASKNIRRLLTKSRELRQGNYESAIEQAIQAEEKELLQGFWAGEELFAVAGSTAALVVVNLTRGILVVANLGDSHVLLGEDDGANHTSLKVRPLTVVKERLTTSHKPEDAGESHRIESAGGTLNTESGVSRVG
ncbi:hypothetical protein RIB2604_00802570 [Aspergillus luchuensis]|uniref:PPM-type phosphatase domain-containing protein n=1 Tax=Aspergillus kawachii TaxID=1069201 RepID=A0A146F4W5_ASPKA|nr:hypothetical protein RIB2604_00802570 [Aspergillus luchuensis]